MLDSNALVSALTETHLSPDILDAEVQIEGYTLFRADRILRSHGGVAMYAVNEVIEKF